LGVADGSGFECGQGGGAEPGPHEMHGVDEQLKIFAPDVPSCCHAHGDVTNSGAGSGFGGGRHAAFRCERGQ
jgi:hypothetical protein